MNFFLKTIFKLMKKYTHKLSGKSSSVSDKLAEYLNLKLLPLNKKQNYKTANGTIQCLGRIKCSIIIGYKTLPVKLNVLKSLQHPFILGLDLISTFGLEISPNLQIFQHISLDGIRPKEEIY